MRVAWLLALVGGCTEVETFVLVDKDRVKYVADIDTGCHCREFTSPAECSSTSDSGP
jgi:hypothetical protein